MSPDTAGAIAGGGSYQNKFDCRRPRGRLGGLAELLDCLREGDAIHVEHQLGLDEIWQAVQQNLNGRCSLNPHSPDEAAFCCGLGVIQT